MPITNLWHVVWHKSFLTILTTILTSSFLERKIAVVLLYKINSVIQVSDLTRAGWKPVLVKSETSVTNSPPKKTDAVSPHDSLQDHNSLCSVKYRYNVVKTLRVFTPGNFCFMFHFLYWKRWLSIRWWNETCRVNVSFLVSMFHLYIDQWKSKKPMGEKQKHCGSDLKTQWERNKNTMGAWKRSHCVLYFQKWNIDETLLKHRTSMFHILKALIINSLWVKSERWKIKKVFCYV